MPGADRCPVLQTRRKRAGTSVAACVLACAAAIAVARVWPPPPAVAVQPAASPVGSVASSWRTDRALALGPEPVGLIGDAALVGDSLVYVLDVVQKRVGMLSVDGSRAAWTGQSGRGPGEFIDPVALGVGAEGSLYVVDRGNLRVETYAARSGALEQVESVTLDFFPEDACVLGGRLFVLGARDGRAIHEVSPRDGRVSRSFAPDKQLRNDMLATFRAAGHLACGPGESLSFLPMLRPTLHRFSAATGEPLGTITIPDYREVLISHSGDAVTFRQPEGGHDRGASLVPLADGSLMIQVGLLQPGAHTPHEFQELRSFLLSSGSNSIAALPRELPRAFSFGATRAIGAATEPEPALLLLTRTPENTVPQ
jgi:hypothetical protein